MTRAAPSPGDAVSLGVLAVAAAGLGLAAVLLGADGNYDLRNYHFYAGWALLHKPVGFDLAPAQVQSYHHPLLDALFYLVSRALNGVPRGFTFVWALPQAAAVWCAFLIAREVCDVEPGLRDGLAVAAAVIGAGGAASLGVVGTSMSEGVPNLLVLGAGWLALRGIRRERAGQAGALSRFAAAGALVGAAVGLKLTMAPYAVGFGAACLLTPGVATPRRRAVLLGCLGGAALAALLAVGLPWWLAVWRAFGNPLFPYLNAWFRSPLYGAWNFVDDRFLPRTAWEWLAYPLEWTLRKSRRVSEEPVRDARLLLVVAGSLLLVALGRGLRSVPATWCAIFALVTYAMWLPMFSILRYASGLETLSGVIVVAAIVALPRFRLVLAWGAAGLLLATTVVPTWERRRDPGDHLVAVTMPAIAPDSLVLMLVAAPASYVAAWAPRSARFVGLNNSLLRLDSTFGMQGLVERTIRDAPGPIWGLEKTDAFFGEADLSLRRYGLRRTAECADIGSNIDTHLRLCRLERVKPAGGVP